MKLILIILVVGMVCIAGVGATSVNYYYSPNCGHCQRIVPFINQMVNTYRNVKWNILDVTQGSYNIQGTPTLILNTNGKREITLVGSQEIPRWLECELNEQSNLKCPTYSATECRTDTWFIR